MHTRAAGLDGGGQGGLGGVLFDGLANFIGAHGRVGHGRRPDGRAHGIQHHGVIVMHGDDIDIGAGLARQHAGKRSGVQGMIGTIGRKQDACDRFHGDWRLRAI